VERTSVAINGQLLDKAFGALRPSFAPGKRGLFADACACCGADRFASAPYSIKNQQPITRNRVSPIILRINAKILERNPVSQSTE